MGRAAHLLPSPQTPGKCDALLGCVGAIPKLLGFVWDVQASLQAVVQLPLQPVALLLIPGGAQLPVARACMRAGSVQCAFMGTGVDTTNELLEWSR